MPGVLSAIPVSYTHLDVYKRQGQHRTILSVESRRQIFWQVKQKCSRILCVFASIFVTAADVYKRQALGVNGAAIATVLGTVVASGMALRSVMHPDSFLYLSLIHI